VDSAKKPNLTEKILSTVVRIFLILFVLYFLLGVFISSSLSWPILRAFERKHIYTSSREQVEKAGGWKSIEQACLNFSTNGFNPNLSGIYYFHGHHLTTNSLPPTIDLLQPMFIRKENDKNGVSIFQIQLHGIHRTGTFDEPYYGIFVVCTNRSDYVPEFGFRFRGSQGIIERKGDLIFEVR
jgi:hypothetical protein